MTMPRYFPDVGNSCPCIVADDISCHGGVMVQLYLIGRQLPLPPCVTARSDSLCRRLFAVKTSISSAYSDNRSIRGCDGDEREFVRYERTHEYRQDHPRRKCNRLFWAGQLPCNTPGVDLSICIIPLTGVPTFA